MSVGDTLRELFVHNDWGRDRVMALAVGLGAEQLDRPFEMGPGSLRATLRHLYGAERVWFERWLGAEQPRFPRSRDVESLDGLWTAFRELADARNAYLDGLSDGDLRREVTYTSPQERTYTFGLGDLMLHVCNHGVHHRTQVLNMLRHAGVKPPGLDYLFMKIELPSVGYDEPTRAKLRELGLAPGDTTVSAARLEIETIRAYFRYCDWAADRVHTIAETLSDAQLDREFEIGVGSLRKTLLHIRDGEQWWYENWTIGPQSAFRELSGTTAVSQLRPLFREIAQKRDAYLDRLDDDDLQRVTTAEVRPGLMLPFRLGETMLQLCGHGTHHRAQTLNMLRRLGAEAPALDYTEWLRET